jgi:oligopeptide transport system ATP-binding protein
MPSIPASAEAGAGAPAVLSLARLGVTFDTPERRIVAAEDVTLSVARGECLGVVGESGAGKSQVFLALMGLLAANGRVQGSARFEGTELLTLSASALDRVRGAGIGMVFQDPMTSLTPHLTVGDQLIEVLRRHAPLTASAARERSLTLLKRVQVTDPAVRLGQYPHELSGGMRQRVMIAIALAGDPSLLIADEPTTSLDVTIQAQILALLAELRRERAMAMILITHDLGAVAGLADRVVVMRAGHVIESGAAARVLKNPEHAYTRSLVQDAQRLDVTAAQALAPAPAPAAALSPTVGEARVQPAEAESGEPAVLAVADLRVDYGVRRGWFGARARLTALTGVSLELRAGDALGIVGESGSGKSTLARAALELLRATSGRVLWMGTAPALLPPAALRALRRDLQIIFQDPLGSLDPRMTVAGIIAEPLRVHERSLAAHARQREVVAMLARVGLAPELAERYPHELSGGQCQRVGIARAMILRPKLLVCDEPLSALDRPTQQQIVTLLAALRASSQMAMLFISHNLALVRQLCGRVLVLYLGRMMELAPAAALYGAPRHPYTRELLAAIPSTDPDIQPARLRAVRGGEPPSPLAPPSGCVYRTRCPQARPVCAERVPAWEQPAAGEGIACLRWRELE